MPGRQPVTYVTYEYPLEWKVGREAYYPVQDGRNSRLHQQYKAMAAKEKNVIFGGRLADYQYYDMDDVIRQALSCVASRCVTGLKEREESY
jgi:UDP-galactopyranose mutase